MDATVNKDGSIEANCMDCGEPMLFFPGDQTHIRVADDEKVVGMLCSRCFEKPETNEDE